MADVLKFNLDELRSGANRYRELSSDLKSEADAMKSALEGLRKDWKSAGADAFFDKVNTEWYEAINSYASMLADLSTELSQTVRDYSDLVEQYESIRIDI